MSTILRYAKHLRRLNGVGWRVVLNQPQSEVTGVVHGFHQTHPLDLKLTKSYATNAATKSQISMYGYNDTVVQQLEAKSKRSGRISKLDIEQTLFDIQSTGTLSSIDALFMIRSCGRTLLEPDNQECIKMVQDIWETCERLEVLIDVSHFNTLLNVYLEKEYKFSPSTIISKMLEKKIEPNRVTYQKLIAAYCMQGDMAGATKILEIMKDKSLPLCENIFNSLITGHSESNDLESAVGILKTMESAGIEPSSETYEALLRAYAKHGDMEALQTTLDELENTDRSLSHAQLLEIAYALAANGHTAAAEKFIDERVREVNSDSDVGRILVKLIHINQIPVAMKVFKATSTNLSRQNIRSIFLLRAAVKNPNVADIIHICKWCMSNEYNSRSFQIAIYHSLTSHCDPNVIIPLLKAWRESGGEIRQHYFWPLLRSYTKKNDYDGMIGVIKTMVNDFQFVPSIETLRDYVIPYMFGTWQDAAAILEAQNIPRENIYLATVDRLLFEKKMRNAGMFMTKHPMKYPKEMFLNSMAESFIIRNDPITFLATLRLLDREPDASDDVQTPVELVDAAVSKILDILPIYRYRLFIQLLDQLMSSGLSISPEVGDRIKSFLQDRLTPDIEGIIEKLTSGTLTQVSLAESNPYNYTKKTEDYSSMVVPELRALFAQYYESRNTRKVRDILRQMEAAEYRSPAVLAQAIHLFCEYDDLEAAEECMNVIKTMESVKLDNVKMLKYASLLVKKNRFNDAIEYISEQPDAEDSAKKSRIFRLEVRKLFDMLGESNQDENLIQMFKVLQSKNFIEPDIYTLGPLINVHIKKNDLESALKAFERACIEYKCSPYKNVLLKAFVQKEDANSLQKITDLCTELHGEANALIDLAFTFLDCNRPRQAQKILETSGMHIHNDRIAFFVERYSKADDMKNLEQLSKITRGVTRMDHGFLFNRLLDVYVAKNDWERGLALWTEMQEVDILPTQEFLMKLSSLLKRNHQNVPFVLSEDATIQNLSNTLSTINPRKSTNTTPSTYKYSRFNEALSRQDYNLAEHIILSNSISNWDQLGMYGRLIKCMLNNDDIDRALDMMIKVIKSHSRMIRSVFGKVTDKLIDAGRVNDIEALNDIMEEDVKLNMRFYKIRAIAQIKSSGLKKFLENMEIQPQNDNPRDLEAKIHFGALVHGLIADPSALPLMKETAQKLLDVGIDRGMHVLWNYYVITNSSEADNLWMECVSKSSSPLIRPIIEYAESKQDTYLLEQVDKKLRQNPNISVGVQVRLMTALITIHNALGNYKDALQIVHHVRQRFNLSMVPLRELQKLKANLENDGQYFPYKIEEDQTSHVDVEENNVGLHATKL